VRFIDRGEVARRHCYDVCLPIVRQAMIAFSKGETRGKHLGGVRDHQTRTAKVNRKIPRIFRRTSNTSR
jgi:hypothetical protein